MEELIIDDSNFAQYFRDCRTSRPERGDIIARYSSRAELVEGKLKEDLIDLLANSEKALPATRVLAKLGGASHADSIRVCREICEDLAHGMSRQEILEKIYEYEFEMFYYAKMENVPLDHHWTTIGITNLDTFLDSAGNKVEVNSKVLA